MRLSKPLRQMGAIPRTYENANAILLSRARHVRPQVKPYDGYLSMPSMDGGDTMKGRPSINGMSEWLKMLGHSEADINALNIIHVAGTKGKGSTCAFIESFLRSFGSRSGIPMKTGLYTSPHLVHMEERIRINFQPLSHEMWAKYFFEVYDGLGIDDKNVDAGPRYLQLLAIMAFHTFIREEVDVAVIEPHNGGEFDATNVVTKPVVCVITKLAEDHVLQLGGSLESIAWHKSGIFKKDAVAVSTIQEAKPTEVLKERAAERGCELELVGIDEKLPTDCEALEPDVQRENASLALRAANGFLGRKIPEFKGLTDTDINEALDKWVWPGRFQKIRDGNIQWFLDGAHNELSVEKAAHWFSAASGGKEAGDDNCTTRILIFSHVSQIRDGEAVLRRLKTALDESNTHVDHAIFTTYPTPRVTMTDKGVQIKQSNKDVQLLEEYVRIWNSLDPKSVTHLTTRVYGAVQQARRISSESSSPQILVTGNIRLVGLVFPLIKPENS